MARNITTGQFEFKDLTNVKTGKLTVLHRTTKSKHGTWKWMCQCDCGKYTEVFAHHLSANGKQTKSCGCLKHQSINKTHGLRSHPMYSVWRAMKYRCCNEKAHNYKDYGGRGIKVCDRWLNSFANFYEDMKDGYVKGEVMLDRKEVNKGYEPSNCRWLSYIGSANNKRTSKYLSLNGIVRTAAEWSRILGIKDNTITNRKLKGFSDAACLSRVSLLTGNPI